MPFLFMAIAWSLFLTCGSNLRQPNELLISAVTFGWVVGNGIWTLFDYAEVRGRVLGTDVTPEAQEALADAAGYCFAASFGLGLLYFVYLRWTDRFAKARASNGSWAALERSYKEDVAGYGAVSAVAEDGDGGGSREVGSRGGIGRGSGGGGGRGRTLDDLIMFDGPAFLPNAFVVSSWVEYEGAATFLWICKDFAWWLAVEKEIPHADDATVIIGICLISYHVDMLVNAFKNDDVMGLANLVTLLFWVTSMFTWALGEMYQSEEVCRVVPLLTRPDHPENLRWIASWIMICGGCLFVFFWIIYLMLFVIFDDGLALPFHAYDGMTTAGEED